MSGRIFINYRRGDDPGNTGRLFDRLQEAFRPEQLFMDVDNIAPGLDFVHVLEQQVGQCDALLAVIGPRWLDALDHQGNRRLDNPDDFVRIEIESALSQGKRVIPVLVGDARMPRPDELPETMRPFVRRHAVRLTHERFGADTQVLVKALQQALEEAETARRTQEEAAAQADAARRAHARDAARRAQSEEKSRASAKAVRRWRPALGIAAALILGAVGAWLFVALPARSPAPERPAGELIVTGPDELTFKGPQGGPFEPSNIALQLKASGSGVRWSRVGANPDWLGVTPDRGELAADQSTEAVVTLTQRARSLSPGGYDGSVAFVDEGSGTSRVRSVNLVVSLRCAVDLVGRADQPLSASEECALRPKDAFRECGGCPEMVVAPAGTFTMGSPARETGRKSDEGPDYKVAFAQPFAVGRFAVTFEEWDACVREGGCNGHRPDDVGWGRGRRPVINVSWADANAYAAWLSKKTGKTYRLPSEAEREYATRAGTATAYSWGNEIGRGNANCRGCGSPWDANQTAPVGSFKPNAFGLHEMHGNVREWVEDCYHGSYKGAPDDGSAWIMGDCGGRVVRGGSWFLSPDFLRSASRDGAASDVRFRSLGFRVGRTLAP